MYLLSYCNLAARRTAELEYSTYLLQSYKVTIHAATNNAAMLSRRAVVPLQLNQVSLEFP